jgi:AsmA-like C-terminal region
MSSHRKLRKISIWLGAAIMILIIVGGISLFLVKQYVNPELIKSKILASLTQRAGGKGEIEDIEVKFFYRPHVVITGGHLSLPDKLEGSFETLIVYPRLLPLLKGDVRPYYVKLVNPSVKLFMEEGPEELKVPAAEPLTMEGLKAKVITVLKFLDTNEKDSKVEIKDGQLSIVKNDDESLYLQRFNATIEHPNNKLNIYISGSSNLSGRILFNGWVNTESYNARGSLRLVNFHPHKVINLLKPQESLFQDSNVDLTLGFDIKELMVFDLNLKSPAHNLTLAKGGEELLINGKDLDVDIYFDQKSTRVSLNKAHLLNPGLKAKGSFSADTTKNEMKLDIEGTDLEVEPSRKGVLLTAGDNHIVDIIFKIVKGGKVPEITLSAKGSSLKDLFQKGNYVVKGKLVDGKVFIPGAELDLFDVSGDALISGGLLKGTNLSAKMGNSIGTEGSLIVGTEGPIGALNLDMDADADLNDITPLLKRFVHDEGFQEELALITNIDGRVKGKMNVGDKKESPKVSFKASSYDLTADYGRVPYPVKVNGTKFDYVDKSIDIGDMNVSVGNFISNAISGSFKWQDIRELTINSEVMSIDLSEFYPWFSSHETMDKHMGRIESMSGSLHMSPFSFAGSISTPEQWEIESSGEMKNLGVNLKGLDDAITTESASFNVTPDKISFSETKLETKSSWVNIDLIMRDYVSGSFGLELNFKGNVDADTSNAVSDMVKVPKQISILGDVSISDSSVTIDSNKNIHNDDNVTSGTRSPASTKEYKLDLNFNADSFEWADPQDTQKEPELPETEEPDIPRPMIYGNLNFNSGEFIYMGFNWDMVNGGVEFSGDKIDINIQEASLCGISTPGYFEVSTPGLKLDFKPNSTNEDFAKTLDCLFKKAGIITGEYNFDGNVYSNGSNDNVVKSLEGELKLTSIDGHVQKYGGLAKFLTVLNFGEIFRGKGTHFGEGGFPYNFLTASVEIKDGKMNITRAAMDGPSLKVVCTGSVDLVEKSLDLELVVIPILAVDSVINKIPLISQLLGEKSSSIPVKITGSWSDPKISQLSPHTIKSGLLTIIKETLNIPVTLIKPVRSGMEKEKAKEEERREKESGQNGEQD